MKVILRNRLFLISTILVLMVSLDISLNVSILKQKNLITKVLAQTTENIEKPKPLFKYIEITEGCDHSFRDGCVNVRSGPGKDYKIVSRLRNRTVLKVDSVETRNGEDWYKISFDEWLRYPDRITEDWYVSADVSNLFYNEGTVELNKKTFVQNNKHIVISLSEQTLYAYDGDYLFMKEKVSTGVKDTETPTGNFIIYRKTPSRYMQGPIPGATEKEYDTPGVPWDLYFTKDGAVIHGAFWHNNFGKVFSNGCVNLPPEKAKILYAWADVGVPVIVNE